MFKVTFLQTIVAERVIIVEWNHSINNFCSNERASGIENRSIQGVRRTQTLSISNDSTATTRIMPDKKIL